MIHKIEEKNWAFEIGRPAGGEETRLRRRVGPHAPGHKWGREKMRKKEKKRKEKEKKKNKIKIVIKVRKI